MRLDKYLKVSRLVKRRTLAKEISDQGRVTVNGNVGKMWQKQAQTSKKTMNLLFVLDKN